MIIIRVQLTVCQYYKVCLLVALQKELVANFTQFFVRMLKGRSFPGKVMLTRRSEPLSPPEYSPRSENDRYEYEQNEGSQEVGCRFSALLCDI